MGDFTTSAAMRKMIEEWEGLRLDAYRDMVGVLTIGYGHTGPDVTEGLSITQAQADALLGSDLQRFEHGVNDYVRGAVTSQQQFDALVSFSYNLGLGNLLSSTLLRLHKAGDYTGAADEFQKWDRAGGQEVEALLRRREAEAEVYLNGAYA